jgi:effector-binding domain-containing protein
VEIEPHFVKREAQPYAGIRERMGRDDRASIVPRTLSALFVFLEKHRMIHLTGSPLIRYFVDYNNGTVEVDVGVPLDVANLPADDCVHSGQIPAGTFATVIHRGPYDTLMKTTAALLDWSKQKNVKWDVVDKRRVTSWNARVEHYLVGPPDEPNPRNWQTEIAILVSERQTRIVDTSLICRRFGQALR